MTSDSEDTSTTRDSAPPTEAGVLARIPIAERRPHSVEAPHGASRQDEYYWLRDDARRNPEILAYLRAENDYADAVMAPLRDFEARLYAELLGRLKQDDSSVPARHKDYWYYTRYEEGREYPIHARRKGDVDAPEEIMLDLNELAAPHSFYEIGNWQVSPDQMRLAYLEDSVGRRQYTLKVKNLDSGKTEPIAIPGLSPSVAWSADSRTVFYVENDPETLLSKRVKAHTLGTDSADDATVYAEPDDAFYLSVRNSRSEAYVCVDSSSTLSTETRYTSAATPGELRILAPRQRDFEYHADHLGDRWVIRTNWEAKNFKLMSVADGRNGQRDAWRDLIPHDDAVLIEGFALFRGFVAVQERSGGLTRVRLLADGGTTEYVAAEEPAYTMHLSVNPDPDAVRLRYVYTSLTTPVSTYELDVETGERRLLKEAPVLGGFDKSDYVTERLWALASDGIQIPVSVVYRKGFQRDGKAALLQYGYGAYGLSMDPVFNSNIVSLLDRGMAYAIAHVRGGQELGRRWYESGKLLEKRNTFTDFIAVTDHLVAKGYAAPERVAALGASAGGLLVGAVANMAPDRYRVIVSRVPFVDVLTTMLDTSIPLTSNEFDEWGNPEDEVYYKYILSYSPYDQIGRKSYPAMYIYTGLWDSQVQYFEPAKYVARLRERKTDANLIVLRVAMEAGHGGQSGRFQRYRETAEQFAFLLDQLGIRR